MLIEVGWKKSSSSPSSARASPPLLPTHPPPVVKSCAGAGEDPFAKMKDSITDTINRVADERSVRSQSDASQCIKETVP